MPLNQLKINYGYEKCVEMRKSINFSTSSINSNQLD